MSSSSPMSLPDDIIAQILSWLPVVLLLRFKSTCKTWRDIIERDDDFIEKHHHRATTCYRYQHKHVPENTTFIADTQKREVFCCIDKQKGLVLEQDLSRELLERLRIRNPATRQAVYLPVIGGTYCTLARMFFVGKSCCKVISYSQEGKSVLEERFRAITVDTDAAWRPLNNNNSHDTLQRISILYRKSKIYSLSIGNVFHVVTMDNKAKKILSVNAENERCESEEIPETLFSDWDNVEPREWDSKLSLYSQDEENNIKIWVFQNHDWAKTTIVMDYPVPFVAKDAILYIEKLYSSFWWLHSRFLYQNEVAVVVIKPTILQLKGMETMPQEAIDYWKEEVVLIPSSQIISLVSLLLMKTP